MAENSKMQSELEELTKEYSKTKYNKATNKYLGKLRAKIANIKKSMATKSTKKGIGFAIRKSGDATVALVGFPNAGKSSLLTRITDAESKIANYAFTTLEVIPGMMHHKGAKIQVFDLPGLIRGAHLGKGGGTQIASAMRSADLILFVIDCSSTEDLFILLEELDELGIKVGVERPNIKIERRLNGGIRIEEGRHKTPDKQIVTKILNEFGIFHADVVFHTDTTDDDILDYLSMGNVYINAMVALNKVDLNKDYEKVCETIRKKSGFHTIPISVTTGFHVQELKDMLFNELGLIRIYLKPKDGAPDYVRPMIMHSGNTVVDVARKLHSKVGDDLKAAYVSGKSVKFLNQKVGKGHVLKDEDIITLIY